MKTPLRVFIVGCPRSGTSVIQAVLGRVAELLAVPETQYFAHLLGGFDQWLYAREAELRRKWQSRLAVIRARTYSELTEDLAATLSDHDLGIRLPRRISGFGYMHDFARILDRVAEFHSTAGWVEKTPHHLMYVELIQRFIPSAQFIHVVRNGEDVVASLVDGEMHYAQQRYFYGGVGYNVHMWNRCVQTTQRFVGQPRHLVLRHEDFVADPESTIRRAIDFVGARADQLRERLHQQPSERDLSAQPWKQNWLSGPIAPQKSKFESVLGPVLQKWARDHLLSYGEFSAELARRQPH